MSDKLTPRDAPARAALDPDVARLVVALESIARSHPLAADDRADLEAAARHLAETEQRRIDIWDNPEKWMRWCDVKVLERAEAAEAENALLRKAISAKHATHWSAEQLATLAQAHREDSESLDDSIVREDSWSTEYDYDAARLKVRQRLENTEAENQKLRALLRKYGDSAV